MIYLDYASTTPTDKRVLKKMLPYFEKEFANPSALYSSALKAKKAIDKAREILAKFLNSKPDEIIFTSGGTESDNLAIFGVAKIAKSQISNLKSQNDNLKSKIRNSKLHIITSQIEHPAVLNVCKQLEKEGFEVTYLPPDKNGIVSAKRVEKALKPNTILVSIMYANNEIGTIQPVSEIADVICNFRKVVSRQSSVVSSDKYNKRQTTDYKRIVFHTDACQATGYLPMDVKKLDVDLLTLNGSKIYGPKGVGALYIREGTKIKPIFFGGGQENGLRPGTENVAGAVGLAEAIKLISGSEGERERKLRDYLIQELLKIEGVELNGDKTKRLPNNINVSIKGVEGEALVLYLDRRGIAVATGSACSSKSLEPSHVIQALGKGREVAHSSLRITLGRQTTRAELDKFIKEVKIAISKLRKISGYNG
jgi:cysteine desulfurase